jgi:hypothetical protein
VIDGIINLFKKKKEGGKTLPKNYIKKKLISKKGAKEIDILLPGWGERFVEYEPLKKRILKKGHSCLEYTFHPNILTSDYKQTLKCFKEIKKSVRLEIKELSKKYKKINLYGTSLGCVNACRIANNNPLINKIVLIVPGHCLAESVWTGIKTQEMRKEFEKKGVTLKQLKKYWERLAPINNIDGLQNKKIDMYLSQADELIRHEGGTALITGMKKEGLKPKVFENKFLGHYLTILKFYYFPKDIT